MGMSSFNRRNFLKASGLSVLPAFIPAGNLLAANKSNVTTPPAEPFVEFYSDGRMYNATDYIQRLQEINAANPIRRDSYGNGGAVAALEKKFEEITGKEKAIFMPSGTMANQLAISVLSGADTKVFVQETSHVFRDEADAAQSVYQKRLIPLAKGEAYFTQAQLLEAVTYHDEEEVFKSGMGCVSIENPVRRGDGRMVPIEEIRKISEYCRKINLRMHLDGARIYLASAWSGISVKEYASHFNTIYISLYKYLGAAGGAVLCGDKEVIGKMQHLIKIHGGNMFGNWANAAMALDRLSGIEDRLQKTKKQAEELFASLNQVDGIKITHLNGGTNIYSMKLGKEINGAEMSATLSKNHSIAMPEPDDKNEALLTVNETLLYRDTVYLVNAFKTAAKKK
jgi:threonine aldolase